MRLLSLAMSTPIALVRLVIVARIRCWWTPWPSWTSEYLSSRMKGMSRLTASSMRAWVEGPKADRSASRMSFSRSSPRSNGTATGSTRWFTRATASRPASTPTVSSRNS